MKRRQPKRPSLLGNAEKCDFKPWQMVYVNSEVLLGNIGSDLLAKIDIIRFLCVLNLAWNSLFLTGNTLSFGLHETHFSSQETHFPLVNMKFVSTIGNRIICYQTSQARSKVKNLKYWSEKTIGDLDRNNRVIMTDTNIPPTYWDIVVQHTAYWKHTLLLTIFESDTGVVPDLAVFPPRDVSVFTIETK